MYCLITGMKTESSGHSTILVRQQFQSDRKHGETGEFLDYEPKATFTHCKISPLVRSNAVWNTMGVNKTFYMSINSCLARSIEGKST